MITHRDTFQHTHEKNTSTQTKSVYLDFFFFVIAELKMLIAKGRTLQRRSMTYFICFCTTKDCEIKRSCGFPAYKKAGIIQQLQIVKKKGMDSFKTYIAQLFFLVDTMRKDADKWNQSIFFCVLDLISAYFLIRCSINMNESSTE